MIMFVQGCDALATVYLQYMTEGTAIESQTICSIVTVGMQAG